mmetsp:Transcript_29387/g.57352  ORF Transcript_29387/g.57352 Transcript_29387/m.57352 type:complete len:416 (-) Transcript_29387:1096-2343(-)
MLGFGVVVGLIVFNIDRSMWDDKFKQDGLREAKRRGAQCQEPDKWPRALWRVVFRLSFALVFAALIGEVYAKKFLGPDIVAYATEQNQIANRSIFANAAKIANAEIQTLRDEIAVLDKRAESSLAQQAAEVNAGQAALKVQRGALTTERSDLRKKFDSLSERYLCVQQDLIAEEFGGTRCDQTTAQAGKGAKYNTAVKLSEQLEQERRAVEERIDEIDEMLTQLRQVKSRKGSVGSAEALLISLSTHRAQATKALNALVKNQDIRINAIAIADPDYQPDRDGIIQRGEALIEMAQGSNWALLTIALLSLFLFILDLGAVLVMTITPAPENIAVERVMAGAATSGAIVAGYTVKIADSAEIELAGQRRLIAAYNEIDALKSQSRVQMAVRRSSEDAVYGDIKDGLASASKTDHTIH